MLLRAQDLGGIIAAGCTKDGCGHVDERMWAHSGCHPEVPVVQVAFLAQGEIVRLLCGAVVEGPDGAPMMCGQFVADIAVSIERLV